MRARGIGFGGIECARWGGAVASPLFVPRPAHEATFAAGENVDGPLEIARLCLGRFQPGKIA